MITSLNHLKRINPEEFWNVVTHGLGFLLSILGLFLMIQKLGTKVINLNTYSVIVFCSSLILLFAASTLYHYCWNKKISKQFRILDHISIYYVIAGTYTPFMIILYNNSVGDFLLKALWGIALFGTIFKVFFTGKFEKFSLALYIAMGWLVIFRIDMLIDKTPTLSLVYLIVGGLSYTIGTYFYANDKIHYNHPIWHLFVLGGAFFHYLSVYSFL